MIVRVLLCLFAMTLCGCGPSAKQIAEQQSRERFRESVGAVKVCTTGSTYSEFREKRQALEACYAANQSALQGAAKIHELCETMDATDVIWAFTAVRRLDLAHVDVGSVEWNAMVFLNPNIVAKKDYSFDEREDDPARDFNANTYVHLGLSNISILCDDLLKQ
jgi:hypothetical protein